jgi:hypothetical protein
VRGEVAMVPEAGHYPQSQQPEHTQRGLAVRAKNELAAILAAIAHAYRAWAREHPGRYAAAQHAPATNDSDDIAASQAVLDVVTAAPGSSSEREVSFREIG